MARNGSTQKLDKARGEFDEAQLAPVVDTLFSANADVVDLSILNGIRDGIRGQIEAELAKHDVFFRSAYRKEKIDRGLSENASDKTAFGSAFEQIYGRFLYERDPEISKSDSSLMKTLDNVLAPGADRSDAAISSAIRRLAEYRDTEGERFRTEFSQKAEALGSGIAAEQILAEIGPDMRKAARLIKSISSDDDLIKQKSELFKGQEFDRSFEDLVNMDSDQVKHMADKYGTDVQFALKIFEIDDPASMSAEMIERRFSQIVSRYGFPFEHNSPVPDGVDSVDYVYKMQLLYSLLMEARRNLVAPGRALSKLQELEDEWPKEKRRRWQTANRSLEAVKKRLTRAVAGPVKDFCDELKDSGFLTAESADMVESYIVGQDAMLEKIKCGEDFDPAVVTSFLRNDLPTFAEQISDLVHNPQSPVDALLDSSFGGSPVELQRRRRSLDKSKESVKKLKEIQNYFDKDHEAKLTAAEQKLEKATEGIDRNQPIARQATNTESDLENLRNRRVTLQRQLERGVGNREEIERELPQIREEIKAKRAKEKALQGIGRVLNDVAKTFSEFSDNASFIAKLGIGNDSAVSDLSGSLAVLDVESNSFRLADLDLVMQKLKVVLAAVPKDCVDIMDHKVAEVDDKVQKEQAKVDALENLRKSSKNITTTQAASRILGAIVAKTNKDLDPKLQGQLTKSILIDDVTRIQTERSHLATARDVIAKEKEVASEYLIRDRLLSFAVKLDDKIYDPFKGMKPEQFGSVAKIEDLFESGKLDIKSGFIVLAAFYRFSNGSESRQTVLIREKLRELVARELGAEDKMDNPLVNKIVDQAFTAQFKAAKRLFKEHVNGVTENSTDIRKARIEYLNTKFKILREKLRLEKIKKDKYQEEFDKIMEEAEDYGLQDDLDVLITDSSLSAFANSKWGMWLADRGFGFGKLAGAKGGAMAETGKELATRGAWGLGKMTLGGTMQVAMMPLRGLRLFSYAILGAFSNRFSAKALAADYGRRAGAYLKDIGVRSTVGAGKAAAETAKNKWNEAKGADKTAYRERTDVDIASEESKLKELEGEMRPEPFEPGKGFADLEKFKKQVSDAVKTKKD